MLLSPDSVALRQSPRGSVIYINYWTIFLPTCWTCCFPTSHVWFPDGNLQFLVLIWSIIRLRVDNQWQPHFWWSFFWRFWRSNPQFFMVKITKRKPPWTFTYLGPGVTISPVLKVRERRRTRWCRCCSFRAKRWGNWGGVLNSPTLDLYGKYHYINDWMILNKGFNHHFISFVLEYMWYIVLKWICLYKGFWFAPKRCSIEYWL